MTYYGGLSSSYNNDMRLSSNYGDSMYQWKYPSISMNRSNCNLQLGVYLDNANFTDEKAKYTIMTYPIEGEGAGYAAEVAILDQNSAPSGWSYVYAQISAPQGKNSIVSKGVWVRRSNMANKKIGADAISVNLY